MKKLLFIAVFLASFSAIAQDDSLAVVKTVYTRYRASPYEVVYRYKKEKKCVIYVYLVHAKYRKLVGTTSGKLSDSPEDIVKEFVNP